MEKENNLIMVIFGASGDLTKRKLIPALYDLYLQNRLPEKFAVLGIGRKTLNDESFIKQIKDFTGIQDKKFLQSLFYTSMSTTSPDQYNILKNRLDELNKSIGCHENYLFYFSTPPSLYATIARGIEQCGLNKQENYNKKWKRVIIEKPFGYDLEGAQQLNKELLEIFEEQQIYRIDHYLGKETVQNIMVTRFSNGIFEPLWNRNFIDHVQITASESIGVEERGGYYDTSGALRDMVQNHLLQVMAMVAMEPPAVHESSAIRNETLKVFQSIRPLSQEDVKNNVIRGQYTASHFRGEKLNGYLEEEGVDKNSLTETFVAMKLHIDNWRWGNVPFFIRTGKRLPNKATEIVIHFKEPPHSIFRNGDQQNQEPNQLIIRIQPDEGLMFRFGMKIPGAGFDVQNVNMDFRYADLSDQELPTAYERLILDCISGDSTLYTRGDALEEMWKIITPIQEYWKNNSSAKMYNYPSGTWGPLEATEFILQTGYLWRNPCRTLTTECDCTF